MIVFLYDTETTGLPEWGKPSEHPDQPHLCQFTGVLFDSATFDEIEYVDFLIRPDGWTIEPGATAIHGITQERALAEGKPEKLAVSRFLTMNAQAARVTGFNLEFDLRIMRIAMLRAGLPKAACDQIKADIDLRKHDVMHQATPTCKIPPTEKMMRTGRKAFKTPNLEEAMEAIFGEKLPDKHDARVDVWASVRLYQFLNPMEPV